MWHVTDPVVVAAITEGMCEHELLVADGHHRYAAARLLARGGTGRLLVAVSDQRRSPLALVALHRNAPASAGKSLAAAGRPVSTDRAALRRTVEQLSASEVLVFTGEQATVVDAAPEAVASAGVAAWVDDQLERAGCADGDVRYQADLDSSLHDVGSGRFSVLLPRPRLGDILEVVRAGGLMARKSTSFRPKPLAGTVMRLR